MTDEYHRCPACGLWSGAWADGDECPRCGMSPLLRDRSIARIGDTRAHRLGDGRSVLWPPETFARCSSCGEPGWHIRGLLIGDDRMVEEYVMCNSCRRIEEVK